MTLNLLSSLMCNDATRGSLYTMNCIDSKPPPGTEVVKRGIPVRGETLVELTNFYNFYASYRIPELANTGT